MDPMDYFRRMYRGDPGIPHTDPNGDVQAWSAAFALSAVSWLAPHVRNLPAHFNWHDKAVKLDNINWKKILEKKQQKSSSSSIGK